jgi:hypothetical protein
MIGEREKIIPNKIYLHITNMTSSITSLFVCECCHDHRGIKQSYAEAWSLAVKGIRHYV